MKREQLYYFRKARYKNTHPQHPTSSSFLTTTPTQPAQLAWSSSRGRRVLALIIQFLLLLITNKIIKFLGNECSHWPLCFRSGMFIRPASLFPHHPGPAICPPPPAPNAESRGRKLGWVEPQLEGRRWSARGGGHSATTHCR